MFVEAALPLSLRPGKLLIFSRECHSRNSFIYGQRLASADRAASSRRTLRFRALCLRNSSGDATPSTPESTPVDPAGDEAPTENIVEQPLMMASGGVTLDLPAVLRERPHWYLVQTVPGLEDNVRMTIEAKVRNTPSMHDKIPQVVVPKLKAMQLSPGGERVEVEEKVFPCYVMVQMILNEETWEFVRSTAYVVQFVGRDRARRGRMGAVMGGRGLVQPQPLSPSEVQRIFHQIQAGSSMMSEELAIQAGDHVRVQRGNLAGHEGVVASVSPVRGKLTVNLRWLNRDVPTEFRFDEVIKIKRKPIDLPPPPSQESTASTVPESGGAAAVRSSRRIPPEERLLALEALSRLDYDWRMLVAMERLDRVPMQALRQYCRAYGLGASGRKVALIERVREHIIETIRLEEEAANSESTTDDAQDTTAE